MQAAPASNGFLQVAGAQAPFPLLRKPPRHRAPVPSQVRFGSQARAGQRGRSLSQRGPHRRRLPTVQPCGATQARGDLESGAATLRPAPVPGGRGPSARSGAGLSGLVSSAARSPERERRLRSNPEVAESELTSPPGPGADGGMAQGPAGCRDGGGRVFYQAAAMLLLEKLRRTRGGERGRPSRFLLPTMPRPGA